MVILESGVWWRSWNRVSERDMPMCYFCSKIKVWLTVTDEYKAGFLFWNIWNIYHRLLNHNQYLIEMIESCHDISRTSRKLFKVIHLYIFLINFCQKWCIKATFFPCILVLVSFWKLYKIWIVSGTCYNILCQTSNVFTWQLS